MEMNEATERLLDLVREIAQGNYSNDIMALTTKDTPEPIRTLAEAMGMMMVKVEAREFRLEGLIEELKDLNQQIKKNTIGVLSALAQALATRNPYTEGHTSRVAELAVETASRMGLSTEDTDCIGMAGQLHDIGKIGFSDRLFDNHEAKTPPELIKEIVRHPAHGARILADLDFLGPAVEYVHCHHERLDGKGYPRHLTGDQIPLGAQIIAVCDGYDAMTTDRPYQKALTPGEALDILRKQSGTRLRTDVVEAFSEFIEERLSD